MENNFVKEIVFYSDILDGDSGIHSWKSVDAFPILNISDKEREILLNIVAIEQIFEGVGDRRELFNSLFEYYDLFLKDFLLATNVPVYLYTAEQSKEIKNRIRSYKGILPQNLNENDFIQSEISIINDYTTFAALIKVNMNNIKDCIKLFPDSKTSFFIISSRIEVFSEKYLKLITTEMISHKGTNIINYLKLVTECCRRGDIICRIGGDGGDREVTFQIFCQKEKKDLMMLQVESALGH